MNVRAWTERTLLVNRTRPSEGRPATETLETNHMPIEIDSEMDKAG